MLELLLKDKLPKASEIEIILIYYCDLACSFCSQDHGSKEGLNADSVSEKIELAKKFMVNAPDKDISIQIMGGELFSDQIPDLFFNEYIRLVKELTEYGNKINKNTEFNFVTNLTYSKAVRVSSLFDEIKKINSNCSLCISYDMYGRKFKEDLFKRNEIILENHINSVSSVITKQSIAKMLGWHKDGKKDNYFDYLYNKYHFFFEYYVPETKNADLIIPSDKEQLSIMKFLHDNYPKAEPFASFARAYHEKKTSVMSCRCSGKNKKITILPGNEVIKCTWNTQNDGSLWCHPETPNDNTRAVISWLDNKGCMCCEYFRYCRLTCFVQADFKTKEKSDNCIYRDFFNYIQNKSQATL